MKASGGFDVEVAGTLNFFDSAIDISPNDIVSGLLFFAVAAKSARVMAISQNGGRNGGGLIGRGGGVLVFDGERNGQRIRL